MEKLEREALYVECMYGYDKMLDYVQNQKRGIRNDKPIIGILTLPSESSKYSPTKYSYIAASYVKFIELGGGRVIPINYKSKPE